MIFLNNIRALKKKSCKRKSQEKIKANETAGQFWSYLV